MNWVPEVEIKIQKVMEGKMEMEGNIQIQKRIRNKGKESEIRPEIQ